MVFCSSGAVPCQTRAEITESQKPFSMICVADKATGFNWKNDDWIYATFKPETYIIRKLDGRNESCSIVEQERGEFTRPIVMSEPKWGSAKRCYLRSAMGRKDPLPIADRCEELWGDSNGKLVLQTIFCQGTSSKYNVQIDGAFVLTTTYGALMKDQPRDSVILELEKCSVINAP